jgi:hypothetical protein
VLYGELQDPHSEFFVLLNANGAASVRNVWRDTYKLQTTMLPCFISHSLATKILIIGKSINFIRLCLQKLPRETSDGAEKGTKKGSSKQLVTSSSGRKSFRNINKSKTLGIGAQVLTDGVNTDSYADLQQRQLEEEKGGSQKELLASYSEYAMGGTEESGASSELTVGTSVILFSFFCFAG